MSDFWLQASGWAGAAVGLAAQWLVSSRRASVVGGLYVLLNWLSWLGVGGLAAWKGAYPTAAFSALFCCVATWGWWRAGPGPRLRRAVEATIAQEWNMDANS